MFASDNFFSILLTNNRYKIPRCKLLIYEEIKTGRTEAGNTTPLRSCFLYKLNLSVYV